MILCLGFSFRPRGTAAILRPLAATRYTRHHPLSQVSDGLEYQDNSLRNARRMFTYAMNYSLPEAICWPDGEQILAIGLCKRCLRSGLKTRRDLHGSFRGDWPAVPLGRGTRAAQCPGYGVRRVGCTLVGQRFGGRPGVQVARPGLRPGGKLPEMHALEPAFHARPSMRGRSSPPSASPHCDIARLPRSRHGKNGRRR